MGYTCLKPERVRSKVAGGPQNLFLAGVGFDVISPSSDDVGEPLLPI